MTSWKSIALFLSSLILLGCQKPELKKPNILIIAVDDLRPELKSFGKDYISSPNIDQLAASGVSFQKHYVNAPSCGPSRYTLLTGTYGPSDNYALFKRAEKLKNGGDIKPSMPEWFRGNGYTTVSVGKVSHHPGGRGGEDWDDNDIIEMPGAWDRHLLPAGEWQHPRGVMHGLANGEIRVVSAEMDVYQTKDGDDNIYPDGLITDEALKQLNELSSDQTKPFFLAVGLIKPHLPFGAPSKYFEQYKNIELPPIPHPEKPEGRSTWHRSGEFNQYNNWGKNGNTHPQFADEVRRHYAACVSYADAQVGKILAELKRTGADKNTIVILWGDHGYHLGEHAIWGKHSLFEESLHSPMIIHYPGMKTKNQKTNAIVETLDIFPTLCDLAGVQIPSFTQGQSLKPIIEKPKSEGHAAYGYTKSNRLKTIKTKNHRLIQHEDGFIELYDEASETVNVADKYPEVVAELKGKLLERLGK
ncbi:sulfatase [uncultured Arcticibacterium sp.]|uniref:sulfatase n=1 Tax=uncultured Arcticibacterium sp. TaxID=2173042 RepID=UPI0030FBB150